MDYTPSNYEQQMIMFFSRRKIALRRIEDLGLQMPYISAKLTFEQLFLEHVVKYFANTETEYLKDGIKTIIECLKEVKKQPVLTQEHAYDIFYVKNKDHIDRFLNTSDHDSITAWINKNTKVLIERDESSKKITEDVLIREIAEFKIRLGRVNVIVEIEEDTLQFKDKKKMEKLIIYSKEIIENPYPDIFVDADAFVLFRELHSIYKDTDKVLADYSFIYRQMAEKDFLIKESYKPEKFRNWLNSEPLSLDVNSKFKIYKDCFTKEKYNIYKYVKSKQ